MSQQTQITVVGSGLAGSQAALTIAALGGHVELVEMRPLVQTPAHRTGDAAELVCSNSLKSESENTAPWLLKDELRKLDSLAMRAAQVARVPGVVPAPDVPPALHADVLEEGADRLGLDGRLAVPA